MATGKCVVIPHRLTDDEDKLIITRSEGIIVEEIKKAVNFREKYFKHIVITKK